MDKDFLLFLGMCRKAGKIKIGESSCEKALRDRQAHLVIIAKNASENTTRKFVNKCFYYKVPVYSISSKEEISAAIGENGRAVLAIVDEGFATGLEKRIKIQTPPAEEDT
ncbi:MAG: ribosomal L7Ae/L30e/S12e/Gadd45 family protein [Clostridiales bacterium]|jgi:ribosomal protein L7Ae-like RNA K-turn-binding protein|nr:ribosomal L7Ae/L30e/S12e/Gadd45 family protein [Clostridiales bacterium]